MNGDPRCPYASEHYYVRESDGVLVCHICGHVMPGQDVPFIRPGRWDDEGDDVEH